MPGPLNYGYFLGIVSVELELPRQHGRGGIVTGGIRGNCFETARHMARLGAHIIIAGQHEREGVSTVKTIREENREAKGHSPHNPVWFCISLALDITDWLESEHTFSKWSLSSWIWRLCCQSGNSSRPSREPVPGSVYGPLHCSVSVSGRGERGLQEQRTHRNVITKHLQTQALAWPLGLQLQTSELAGAAPTMTPELLLHDPDPNPVWLRPNTSSVILPLSLFSQSPHRQTVIG
ncbi:uncharacterized protein ACWYII_005227 isoform 3-T3 [Salvelinus alpinus]